MKIVYISARVQIDTFNFTFPQQAIIVYVHISFFQLSRVAMPNAKY